MCVNEEHSVSVVHLGRVTWRKRRPKPHVCSMWYGPSFHR